jgi:MFS superfamily sulfate permease-like transporter
MHSAVLGRAEGVKGYHDITRYPDARQIPGLILFRWDAPLFFANAELFKDRVLEAVARSATPVNWLVVAAEPVTSVDVTAVDALAELDKTLHENGIELCFAELKDPVKDKLKRFGLLARAKWLALASQLIVTLWRTIARPTKACSAYVRSSTWGGVMPPERLCKIRNICDAIVVRQA